jgi:pyruvate dehydrogenase complex dehydrogenase (E1) component
MFEGVLVMCGLVVINQLQTSTHRVNTIRSETFGAVIVSPTLARATTTHMNGVCRQLTLWKSHQQDYRRLDNDANKRDL